MPIIAAILLFFTITAQAQVRTAVTNGLIGWWLPFGTNASGNLVVDYSSSALNGYTTNSPYWTNGITGTTNALGFNTNSANFVSVLNAGDVSATDAITVSAWLNCQLFPSGGAGLVSKANDSITGQWYLFQQGVAFASNIVFRVCDGTYRTGKQTTSRPLNGTWVHVVFTWSAGTFAAYLNGASETLQDDGFDTGTVTNILSSSIPLNLARRGTGGSYYGCSMADVRVYNRVVHKHEVELIYHEGQPWTTIRTGQPLATFQRISK